MAGRLDIMGIECPVCHNYGAFVAAITADGVPTIKNSDIIAKRLSCGHVVGSQDYMIYRNEIKSVEEKEANEIRKIRDLASKSRMAIWAKINAVKTEE